MRALAVLILGLGLAAVAVVFDIASLYVPAVALVLAAAGSAIWVLLASTGARVEREPGASTVEEGAPYAIRLLLKTGLLPAPGGEVTDPLLDHPVPIAGHSSRRIRLEVRFDRRGRRTIEPGGLVITDPLRMTSRRKRAQGGEADLLVLPRVEPVTAPGGGGRDGAGAGAGGRRAVAAATRGRRDGSSAAELDLDGLRPYRTGTPASRIHWPAVARGGEMVERRLIAESDSAPLVVLDPTAPPTPEALDTAVRAAASLCVHLARRGGCAVLLPGDRRPATMAADLSGWPALHARLALVEAGRVRPALQGARRSGAVMWVSARPDPPRELARASAEGVWLVTPGEVGDAAFLVAGCAGRRLTRRSSTEAKPVAA